MPIPPSSTHAVRAIEVTKTYGAAEAPAHALRGVSLTVEHGERVALVGKSGSGKSTLLNLIGGLDRPSAGTIEVEGNDLSRIGARELAQHRLRSVGMVFQSFNLIPSKTAWENVALPLIFAGETQRHRRLRAQQALEAVGLGHRLTHRPTALSGGEQQRVAIARALINNPRLLLADEPTGNLDSGTAAEIMMLLDEHLRNQSTTLILITHDEELARRCTDRVVRLRDGSLDDEGKGTAAR